ncbi:MAG: beta strand repeat-containing protein, partial [Luteolibacter sp.]
MKSKFQNHRGLAGRSSNFFGLATIALCLAGAGQAVAQSTWSGATNSKWNEAGNWNVLPVASATLNFGGEPLNFPTDNDFVGLTTGTINFTNNGLDIAVVGPPAGTGDVPFTLGTLGQTVTLGGNINTTPIATGGVALTDIVNLNLILNANRSIGTSGNHSVTVNGVISETGSERSLTKGGSFPSGTLTLTENNTYTGFMIIENGTVTVSKIADSGASNLGYGTQITMGFGTSTGNLNYIGSGDTTARKIQLGSSNPAQVGNPGGGSITASGANGGTGLIFTAPTFIQTVSSTAGSRTLTLQGTNTDANQILGSIVDVDTDGSTLTNISKTNPGLWILAPATPSTYTGSTTVTDGTLAGIGTNAFGSTSTISIGGSGTLSLRGDASTSFVKTNDSSPYSVTASANGASINVNQATPAGTGAKTMSIGNLGSSSTANTYQLNFTGANNTSLSIGAVTGAASTSATTLGAVTINNNIASGGTLTVASYTSANAGTSAGAGETVNFGGAGIMIVTGAITPSANPLALTKSGSGTVRLDGASAYTGLTSVTGGALHLNNASALPASGTLTLNGGVLGLGTGDFNRPLGAASGQVNIAGNNSGFAAYGADRIVNLGGASASVTFGAGNFFTTGSVLVLGATTATHTVDFQNPVALTGTRFFRADNGSAVVDARLSGAITGSTTFSKTGLGTLELTNTGNGWTNTTFIDSGTLRLGAADVLPSTTVNIKRAAGGGNTSGILDLNGYSETIGALALGENGNDTVLPAQTPSVVNSSITPATLTLGGALTYDSGSVNQNGQATISANLATGITGNRDINVEDGSATEDLVISGDLTGDAITKLGLGTLVLTAPKHTGNSTVSAGTLTLGAANSNNNASAVTVASGAVLNLTYAGTDFVTGLTIAPNPPLANGVYGAADFPGIITGTGT